MSILASIPIETIRKIADILEHVEEEVTRTELAPTSPPGRCIVHQQYFVVDKLTWSLFPDPGRITFGLLRDNSDSSSGSGNGPSLSVTLEGDTAAQSGAPGNVFTL